MKQERSSWWKVKDQLEKVAGLALHINELTKTVKDQQKAQADINSVLLSEVANVNLTKLLDFDAHIMK